MDTLLLRKKNNNLTTEAIALGYRDALRVHTPDEYLVKMQVLDSPLPVISITEAPVDNNFNYEINVFFPNPDDSHANRGTSVDKTLDF